MMMMINIRFELQLHEVEEYWRYRGGRILLSSEKYDMAVISKDTSFAISYSNWRKLGPKICRAKQ